MSQFLLTGQHTRLRERERERERDFIASQGKVLASMSPHIHIWCSKCFLGTMLHLVPVVSLVCSVLCGGFLSLTVSVEEPPPVCGCELYQLPLH